MALRKDDYLLYSHRGLPACLGKGMSLKQIASGRSKTGSPRYRGVPMDASLGILGVSPNLGTDYAVAVGAALSAKLRGTGQIAMKIGGEGSTNMGEFFQSLNMSVIWNLPVVFLIENNQYAFYTPYREVIATQDVATRGEAFKMPAKTIDGNDVEEVYLAAREATERARAGGGPVLIECKTYRLAGHFLGDPDGGRWYRVGGPQEIEQWRKKDPIERCKAKILQRGYLTEQEFQEIERSVHSEVDDALKFTQESTSETPDDSLKYVFAP